MIPLQLITTDISQKIPLECGFHALSNDLHVEAVTKRNDRFQDGDIAWFLFQMTNKNLVYLEVIDREVLKIRHAGITGAEIINCQSYSQRLQLI